MIGPVFAFVGFVWGVLVARKRGGKRLDCLQYGAGFGIASASPGLSSVSHWRDFWSRMDRRKPACRMRTG